MTNRCSNPATARQQLRHVALLQRLFDGAFPKGAKTERHLCAEHADLIDADWIVVEVVNPGDVASVLRWADKPCDWEEEPCN